MAESGYEAALNRLEFLVGEWKVETSLEGDSPEGGGLISVEWALDRTFLVHRGEAWAPGAPNFVAVVATDPASGAYTFHYFDSRGVVRVYEMDLDEQRWVLRRDEPDFSELPFAQRYEGRFESAGDRIVGQWEKANDGTNWETDFEITYSRA